MSNAYRLLPFCLIAPVLLNARVVQFSGEVSGGREFRKDIGDGLAFVLRPETLQSPLGWNIEIAAASDCGNLAAVVNGPYRDFNALYLYQAYNKSATEAMKYSPREFSFVLNCDDAKREADRLEDGVYHPSADIAKRDKALAELGSSPQGKGIFTIQDYRLFPDNRVDWIKFRVKLRWHSA